MAILAFSSGSAMLTVSSLNGMVMFQCTLVLSSVLTVAVDGCNVPSTVVDRDRTCANAGGRSIKSNTEGVLPPSTAC